MNPSFIMSCAETENSAYPREDGYEKEENTLQLHLKVSIVRDQRILVLSKSDPPHYPKVLFN